MNIGLVNPNRDLKDPAIHLGIGYLASYARSQNNSLKFTVLDTRVAKPREVKEFFDTKFDLVGITASSQVFLEAVSIAHRYKELFPNTPICLGGSHISTVKHEAIDGFPFDFGAYGEGELTFVAVIDYLNGKGKLEDIKGLIFRQANGEIIVNEPQTLISDIDTIPFPAYDLFKMNRYPLHRLTTSRGCPFNCVFCNSRSIWTRRWRKRSAQNILGEIKLLLNSFGSKAITFNDDSFNIDDQRVIELCDLIVEEKLDFLWSTSIRVDLITSEIARKMKQAGCYNVSIGIESANNEALQRMNKRNTIEKIDSGIHILRDAGIDVMGQFMIGNPGDTLETVKESIAYAKQSRLTGVEFYTALPYKDSLLYDFATTHGTMLTDLPSYKYHTVQPRIVFETPEFPYQHRVKAVELATESGYYYALTHDRKDYLLDFGRNLTKVLQRLLGGKFGAKFYLFMRGLYRRVK
ncbi:MAG: radical SAM protein [Bacteroidales bacterium]|nr:radical SAM protein [Bacteroidales bacterium]